MKDDNKLLTLREAYEYLRISRTTLLRFVERGKIKAYKVGNGLRFYENDVRNAVKVLEVEGVGLYDTEGD